MQVRLSPPSHQECILFLFKDKKEWAWELKTKTSKAHSLFNLGYGSWSQRQIQDLIFNIWLIFAYLYNDL